MNSDITVILTPHVPALRRYARALMADSELADDMVLASLEQAIGQWRRRRPDDDARAWIFSILNRRSMTHLRAAGAPAAPDAARARQNPPLRFTDLLSALGALPDELRAVLLLVAVEDLPYADVARVLDVPLGTVMSRLARARAQLHGSLPDAPRPGMTHPHLRRVK